MKKLLIFALALTLAFALVSCGGCDSHVDENGDSVCDKCEEYITVNVKFNVKYDNGNAFSAAKLVLERNGKTIEIALDENGKGSADVPAGRYYVSFDGPYVTDVFGVEIKEGMDEINLTILDNTPDGTKEKPFFISEAENQITLAAGQEIFYKCHASSVKYIRVNNDYIVINYEGASYQPTDGSVEILLNAVSGDFAEFSLKNNSKKEITTTLYFEAPIGSSDNPIQLTENNTDVIIKAGSTVYYSWVADKDGVLVLELAPKLPEGSVEASVTKILEGNIPVKSETDENGTATMTVLKGDIIKIEVSFSCDNTDATAPISISLTINN